MESAYGIAVNVIFAIIGLVVGVGIVFPLLKNAFVKKKTIHATIVDKQSFDKSIYGKKYAPSSKIYYIITFLVENRKMYFYVSRMSYQSYAVGQTGRLTYKGSQLIDFKVKRSR